MSPVRIRSPLPGPLVKRLRHRPFTAVTWVRFPYGSPTKERTHLCPLFFVCAVGADIIRDCRPYEFYRRLALESVGWGLAPAATGLSAKIKGGIKPPLIIYLNRRCFQDFTEHQKQQHSMYIPILTVCVPLARLVESADCAVSQNIIKTQIFKRREFANSSAK